MGYKFTIGKKIGTGFGVLILFIVVVFGATFLAVSNGIETFQENDKISNDLIQVITPSKEKITKLKLLINESKQLTIQWVNNQSREDVPDKQRLKIIMSHDINATIDEVEILKPTWKDSNDIRIFDSLKTKIVTLFTYYSETMNLLPDIASYDDALSFIMARDYVSQDGAIPILAGEIDQNLQNLQNSFERREEKSLGLVQVSSEESKEKFQSLTFYWYLGAILILAAIFIAVFTTKTIVKPVQKLRGVLLSLGRGEFPRENVKVGNDEVGDMAHAMNNLVDGLKSTTNFANNVGQSKFDTLYEPLSDNDELGHALLKMRDELAETERILEKKVEERTLEVVNQRDEIEHQREKLEDLYKDVTDSIVYAKRLQYSILPPNDKIKKICPDSFVYFVPKDIVSGDFYWFEKVKDVSLYASVDCTGHGVPGAFMSMIGSNGLNSAVREHKMTKPAEILNQLNTYVSEALNKEDEQSSIRDGMDMTICAINYKTMTLEYAGANNPLYIVRNNEFIITKADKFAIASFQPDSKKYVNHSFELQKNDVIYVFSDGFADQFGGEKGKKFMYKKFRNLLLEIHREPMKKQKEILYNTIIEWRGDIEQVDDILVIGITV